MNQRLLESPRMIWKVFLVEVKRTLVRPMMILKTTMRKRRRTAMEERIIRNPEKIPFTKIQMKIRTCLRLRRTKLMLPVMMRMI